MDTHIRRPNVIAGYENGDSSCVQDMIRKFRSLSNKTLFDTYKFVSHPIFRNSFLVVINRIRPFPQRETLQVIQARSWRVR